MKRMTSRQRIDASHEARLWITQVVIPAIGGIVIIDKLYPDLKYKIKDGVDGVVKKIKKEA